MDEFELIKQITRVVKRGMPDDGRIVTGIGDDAAVIAPSGNKLVVTTDTLMEGVHFRLNLCPLPDVGWRAAAANLSDLAAMGAEPLAFLVGLQLPPEFEPKWTLALMKGFAKVCRRWKAHVVGGNVCVGKGPLSVAVTAIGEVHSRYLLRSGARPGDAVLVSGPLGSAALGLRLLTNHKGLASRFRPLVDAWRRPIPRIELGMAIVEIGDVHAAIDVSDGLLQDLGHILEASCVGAVIDLERIPLTEAAVRFARLIGVDALDAAISGGDDYQLVICAAKNVTGKLEKLGMTVIGETTRRSGLILRRDGRRINLPDIRGYNHLMRDGD